MSILDGLEKVQQTIELKRAARFKNPVLELPDLVAGQPEYSIGKKAVVYEKKEGSKRFLIYEFKGE